MAEELSQQLTALVEQLAVQMIGQPAAPVQVTTQPDDKGLLVQLTVAQADMGRVIGKRGRTINAVRVLVQNLGARQGQRVQVRVAENGA